MRGRYGDVRYGRVRRAGSSWFVGTSHVRARTLVMFGHSVLGVHVWRASLLACGMRGER